MTEPIGRAAARSVLLLYAVNSFLFLVLSFFFLPDSIVKVVGSAAAVVFALLGLKTLNPREPDTMSFVAPHRRVVIAVLSFIALLQAVLSVFGFAYPCSIVAIPGSTVTVDGKFLARTPDPSTRPPRKTADKDSPENILPWLTPKGTRYWLRWDTHEVRISKKWYVDDDGSQESVQNVWVNLAKLWNPDRAFSNWIMKVRQKPVFKISYGIQEQVTAQVSPADNLLFARRVQSLVDDWDRLWLQGIGQEGLMRYDRAEPYIAALQVVEVEKTPEVEFQICDRAHHTLKALGAIPYTESPLDPLLNTIRENVFSQLLYELGIRERLKLSQLATLGQTLLSSVTASAITAVPATTPSTQPSATPAPQPSVAATPAFASLLTPTPDPIKVVGELQSEATQAVDQNRFGVAVAVQQQLQATLDTVRTQPASEQKTELVRHLQGANSAISTAISKKGQRGRIYIHIANESQREAAGKLQDKLVENQFIVIGIQNVGGRAYIPDTAEVRFFAFPNPPETKKAAVDIVSILKNNGVAKVRPSYVIPSDRDKKESSDINTHFEIWFARDSFAESD
jgi:hypothetical protein